MKNRTSFVVYTEWLELLKDLPDNQGAEIYFKLLEYVATDELPVFDNPYKKTIFKMMKNQVDRDGEKYDEVRRARSESGKIGGKKSGMVRRAKAESNKNESNESNESNASTALQNESDESVNESVCADVNENVFVNGVCNNVQRNQYDTPTLEEIKKYISENNININAETFYNYYEARGWMVSKDVKLKNWKASINCWSSRPEYTKKDTHTDITKFVNDEWEE